MDANRDESIIVELLELKDTVEDQGSARWFLQDLAVEEDSQLSLVSYPCCPILVSLFSDLPGGYLWNAQSGSSVL